MRRIIARLAVLALIFTALFAAPALARTPAQSPATAPCPHSGQYPPTTQATVQTSTTNPTVGQQIKISGVHYCANEDVQVTLAGKTVGTAHTGADGSFDFELTVPGPPGTMRVCGLGASGLPNDADCLNIVVQSAGNQGVGNGAGNNNGGGTAFTGANIALLCALAALLIAGGVAFSARGRRANSATRS